MTDIIFKLTKAAEWVYAAEDDYITEGNYMREAIAEIEKHRAEIAELKDAISLEGLEKARLEKQLVESQAREAKLRDVLEYFTSIYFDERHRNLANKALALPNDDTALREYRKQVLLEAADRAVRYAWTGDFEYNCQTAENLAKMAEE